MAFIGALSLPDILAKSFPVLAPTVAVAISALALLYSWSKDRALKKREYADRIRNAAGTVMAKLERRKELSLSFFDAIQPLLTDTDVKLVKEQDVTATRDFLWRELVAALAASGERILKEELEIAYKDLYGYDPGVQELFQRTMRGLKGIDRALYNRVLQETQEQVKMLSTSKGPFVSAVLGNQLRGICSELSDETAELTSKLLTPFRDQMTNLIVASDDDIVHRRIRIWASDEAFSGPALLVSRYEKNIRCHIGQAHNDGLPIEDPPRGGGGMGSRSGAP
ncbi:MAG TPA: hypothetical protein VJX67_26890 [Blastocatellia bacterium]|nr:hypothetical protein [Blastocatellia bacterium]